MHTSKPSFTHVLWINGRDGALSLSFSTDQLAEVDAKGSVAWFPLQLKPGYNVVGGFLCQLLICTTTLGSLPKIHRSCLPVSTEYDLWVSFHFSSLLPEFPCTLVQLKTSLLLSCVCVLFSSALTLTPCLSHLELRCNYTIRVTQGF